MSNEDKINFFFERNVYPKLNKFRFFPMKYASKLCLEIEKKNLNAGLKLASEFTLLTLAFVPYSLSFSLGICLAGIAVILHSLSLLGVKLAKLLSGSAPKKAITLPSSEKLFLFNPI